MSARKFQDQMQVLRDRRFNIISLNDLVDLIRNKQPLPGHTGVITFDDGFRNFYAKAYPILQEFGFCATVFLVPGYVGKTSKWNSALEGMPVLDLLRWGEIKEMVNNGIDFGAHTMTHEDLTNLPKEEVHRQIDQSRVTIESHIQQPSMCFAYPYGKLNGRIKSIIKDNFSGACSAEMGLTTPASDIYALPRVDMYYFANNNMFRYVGTSAFSLYVTYRSLLRAARTRAQSLSKSQKSHRD